MKLIIQLPSYVCYFLPFSVNANFGSYNDLYSNVFQLYWGTIKTLIYRAPAVVTAISSRAHVQYTETDCLV